MTKINQSNTKELQEHRWNVCNRCLLMEELPFGKICSSAKYVNLTTNKISRLPLPGYVSGCGCKLKNKIENEYSHCPIEKW